MSTSVQSANRRAPNGVRALMTRIRRSICSSVPFWMLLTVGCGESPTPPTPPPGANTAPVARFSLSADSGSVPYFVQFDASGSTDDGSIAAYTWDFGDGSTGAGVTPTHRFEDVGWFRVSLTVTDDRGATDEFSDSVVVDPAPGTGANDLLGSVWWDRDGDGIRAVDETGVPGYMVYLDQNANGVRDPGEVADVTDAQGAYAFRGLHDTVTYRVTQRMTVGWSNTFAGDGTSVPSVSALNRVVGGSDASAGEFPFQVALLAASIADNESAQFCGGSLIQSAWVLTAAHCVEGEAPDDVEVLVGTHDLGSGGTRVSVRRIRIFPEFGIAGTIDNDIALLELDQAFLLSRVWPQDADHPGFSAPGTTATVVGWGRTHSTGDGAQILQKAQIPIISNVDCNAVYGTITDAMICGGPQLNTDACNGDSGGPLAVQNGSAWIQIGIVSFGFRCAAQPGVYARVSSLEPYIQQVVPPEPSATVLVDWARGAPAVIDFGNFR